MILAVIKKWINDYLERKHKAEMFDRLVDMVNPQCKPHGERQCEKCWPERER